MNGTITDVSGNRITDKKHIPIPKKGFRCFMCRGVQGFFYQSIDYRMPFHLIVNALTGNIVFVVCDAHYKKFNEMLFETGLLSRKNVIEIEIDRRYL